MKKSWLVILWAGATALVSFITFQGLSAAQGGVNDSPLTPVVVASTAAASSETTISVVDLDPAISTNTSIGAASAPNPPSSASTADQAGGSGAAVGSTTSPVPTEATTTTTAAAVSTSTTTANTTTTTASTTTTTAAAQWTTTTITSPGGSVTVSYRPGEVRYDAATPAAGYSMEIEETGPEVRVEFEANDNDFPDYEIRARWNNGAFDSEINEKG